MWVKVFSPNVESVEIVQRTEKRKRRARLYYMRYVLKKEGKYCFLGRLTDSLTSSLENPSTIWEAWKISCPTTSGGSLFLWVKLHRGKTQMRSGDSVY